MMRRFLIAGLCALALPLAAQAQSFTEGFDNLGSLTDWFVDNNSNPIGSGSWFQGNPNVFPAHAGAANSYIGVNFQSTTGANTISNWLILPNVTLNNGDTFSFYTRTVTNRAFPDRLQLRLSGNGSSTNVGTLPTDVGDFGTLLLDINPTYVATNYPNVWTQYSVTLSGLGGPTSGRFAFRYFVEDGGPLGNNSDYIGIDSVAYTAIPEPATLSLLALGALGLIRRR